MVGSGGREHSLGWKLSQSPKVDTVYFAPGNGGTENNIPIAVDKIDELAEFANDLALKAGSGIQRRRRHGAGPLRGRSKFPDGLHVEFREAGFCRADTADVLWRKGLDRFHD